VGGHQMCGYYYPAENAKGVVILVHGQVCLERGCQYLARLSDAVSASKAPAAPVLQHAALARTRLDVPRRSWTQIWSKALCKRANSIAHSSRNASALL
jgi:hypothetical protein